ncbi:YqfQ family protein [Oceanobacillus saliphilus]|uniref:YqfQ family protein n=1 Tax=Oceanobacillus saliphilus TaxID=2925834 RepID=UPI00201DB764|nr:YqfQ family protein [Oceanobacillus saliphilus]
MIFPPRQHYDQYEHPMERQSGHGAFPSKFTSKFLGGNTVNSISKTLDTVQHILNMIQSSTPIIEEYGPMIKNLPAMYRMMKAFKEIEGSDEENTKTSYKAEDTKIETVTPVEPVKKTEVKGISRPKLYI